MASNFYYLKSLNHNLGSNKKKEYFGTTRNLLEYKKEYVSLIKELIGIIWIYLVLLSKEFYKNRCKPQKILAMILKSDLEK
ncbi:hypothetical protein AXF36_13165 [Legionella pneumophila subsp. pascullei]|nr:hypothetical protein AXF36_13165 [Legionella pneumophila subsp. pascullei]